MVQFLGPTVEFVLVGDPCIVYRLLSGRNYLTLIIQLKGTNSSAEFQISSKAAVAVIMATALSAKSVYKFIFISPISRVNGYPLSLPKI